MIVSELKFRFNNPFGVIHFLLWGRREAAAEHAGTSFEVENIPSRRRKSELPQEPVQRQESIVFPLSSVLLFVSLQRNDLWKQSGKEIAVSKAATWIKHLC